MAITKNARLFLERTGIRPTFRRPCATIVPGDALIHLYPIARPFPRPDVLRDGFPPPDRALTNTTAGPANDPWHLGSVEG